MTTERRQLTIPAPTPQSRRMRDAAKRVLERSLRQQEEPQPSLLERLGGAAGTAARVATGVDPAKALQGLATVTEPVHTFVDKPFAEFVISQLDPRTYQPAPGGGSVRDVLVRRKLQERAAETGQRPGLRDVLAASESLSPTAPGVRGALELASPSNLIPLPGPAAVRAGAGAARRATERAAGATLRAAERVTPARATLRAAERVTPARAAFAAGEEAPRFSETIQEALRLWRENRVYVDGAGDYHITAKPITPTQGRRGPIAPWNREAKQAFKNPNEFHSAAVEYEAARTAPLEGQGTLPDITVSKPRSEAAEAGTKEVISQPARSAAAPAAEGVPPSSRAGEAAVAGQPVPEAPRAAAEAPPPPRRPRNRPTATAGGGEPPQRPPSGVAAEPPREPTAPTAAARGEGEEFAANIRLSKYPEFIRDDISRVVRENAGEIEAARRGVRSDAQVLADANSLMADLGAPDRLARKFRAGQAFNAEEVQAIRMLMRSKAETVHAAAAAVKESNSSENLAAYLLAQEELWTMQRGLIGAGAEAGRSLRQFRTLAAELASPDVRARQRLTKLVERYGGREKVEAMADIIATIDVNDQAALSRFIRDVRKPSFWDKFSEYFLSSIFSGPATHMRNVIGNATAFASAVPERTLAAAIDIPLARLQGRQVDRFFNEVPAMASGALNGFPEGIRGFFNVLKTGEALGASKVEFLERYPKAIGGPLGEVIRAPLTLLSAEDALFRSINFQAAFETQIVRQAKREGLAGDALLKRLAGLRDDPPMSLLQAAEKEMEHRIFVDDPPALVQTIVSLVGKYPALRFFVPVIRTPANIIRFGLERSPAQFFAPSLRRNLRTSNPEAADQLARATMGTFATLGAAWMYMHGRLTGPVPRNAAERDRFFREGKQPWSMKVGDTWVTYTELLQPVSLVLGSTAQGMQFMEENGEDDPTALASLSSAVSGAGAFILDLSFMSSISDVFNAVNDPQRYGDLYLRRQAASLVPFSGLLRQTAQTLDPTVRSPETAEEAFKANIPGLTGQVPPRLTAFGEEARRTSPALLAVKVSPEKQSAVDAELSRLNVEVGFVGDTIGGEALTREEQQRYQQVAGQETLRRLSEIIERPQYQNAPDATKESVIQRVVQDARETARGIVLRARAQDGVQQGIQAQGMASGASGGSFQIPRPTPSFTIPRPVGVGR